MNLTTDTNLLPYNTFQFSCHTRYFCEITSNQDRQELITTQEFQSNPHLIIWWGSNILLTQDFFDGIVIKNSIMGREIVNHDNEHIYIRCGAGENRNDIVLRTIAQGRSGLENLVSIPGTIGAAPIQNIGAYGVEAKDVITHVEYSDLKGNIYTLTNNECQFGYRDSIFKGELKGQYCISSVTIQLKIYIPSLYRPQIHYGAISWHLQHLGKDLTTITPRDVAEAVAYIRASKLPDRTIIGTAGSFFKNPVISESQYLALKEQFPDLVGHATTPPLVKDQRPQSQWKE
jgi:UDP-N-acetylmuramate dehydrogenase